MPNGLGDHFSLRSLFLCPTEHFKVLKCVFWGPPNHHLECRCRLCPKLKYAQRPFAIMLVAFGPWQAAPRLAPARSSERRLVSAHHRRGALPTASCACACAAACKGRRVARGAYENDLGVQPPLGFWVSWLCEGYLFQPFVLPF